MSLIGIGALIDQSWEHYRTHYKTLLKVSAWLLLVTAINVVAIMLYPIDVATIDGISTSQMVGFVLLILNNTVVAVIVGTWLINMLIGTIKAQSQGGKVQLKALNKQSWRLFFPQILVRIELLVVYGVAMLLPLLLFWFVTNIATTFLPTALVFILLFASLLLFLPPIALAAYLAFTSFALVEDGHKSTRALKESVARVKGRFWPVAFRLLIPKLLYFGIFFLVQFLLVIVIRILMLSVLQADNVLSAVRVEWIALMGSYSILFVFLNPMLMITDHILYNNLKKS